MSDQDEAGTGGLTERGQAVAAGYNALAVDGDDTLTVPEDQPTGTDGAPTDGAAEQTGEAETPDPADQAAPGPADIPAPPVVETTDADMSEVETRTAP